MTFDPHALQCYMQNYWDARKESAHAIAGRLESYLSALSRIDATLSYWFVGRNSAPYPDGPRTLGTIVEKSIVRSELGEVIERCGYRILAWSRDRRQGFEMYGAAGSDFDHPNGNHLDFRTSAGKDPISSIVTYELFKAIALATIACWEPAICAVRSSKLRQDFDNEGWFTKAWMTYVPADHAASVDLTAIPLAETTPDGGLLLSSTTDFFDPDIPAHLEAAHRISQATQHLNALFPEIRKGRATAR